MTAVPGQGAPWGDDEANPLLDLDLDAPAHLVRVPASSANLGPGFDCIGLALGWFDHYAVQPLDQPGLDIRVIGPVRGVPLDETHLVVRTFYHTLGVLGAAPPPGIRLVCHNTFPHGRGLGSSAAAIVAGAAAALVCARPGGAPHHGVAAADGTALTADKLSLLAAVASELEGHPDNASAAVHGGLTLSWGKTPVDDRTPPGWDPETPRQGPPSPGTVGPWSTICLDVHPGIRPVLLLPTATAPTPAARAALPSHVPHTDAAHNSARTALLIHALTREPEHLWDATEDRLHQGYRHRVYPETHEFLARLRAAGHPAAVSGAGPAILLWETVDEAVVGDGNDDPLEALLPAGWTALRPGVAVTGLSWERATLGSLLRESVC